jgi:hypothetical protein
MHENRETSGTIDEPAEQRGAIFGGGWGTSPTQSGERVSQGLNGVREAARKRRQERFTALLHHVSVDLLRKSHYALKRQAAPGVDGVTWQEYETGLEDRLVDLHSRVHRGAYRASLRMPAPVKSFFRIFLLLLHFFERTSPFTPKSGLICSVKLCFDDQRLVCNLSIGFSPTQTSHRSKLRP